VLRLPAPEALARQPFSMVGLMEEIEGVDDPSEDEIAAFLAEKERKERAGVKRPPSAPAAATLPESMSLYEELVRFQREHGSNSADFVVPPDSSRQSSINSEDDRKPAAIPTGIYRRPISRQIFSDDSSRQSYGQDESTVEPQTRRGTSSGDEQPGIRKAPLSQGANASSRDDLQCDIFDSLKESSGPSLPLGPMRNTRTQVGDSDSELMNFVELAQENQISNVLEEDHALTSFKTRPQSPATDICTNEDIDQQRRILDEIQKRRVNDRIEDDDLAKALEASRLESLGPLASRNVDTIVSMPQRSRRRHSDFSRNQNTPQWVESFARTSRRLSATTSGDVSSISLASVRLEPLRSSVSSASFSSDDDRPLPLCERKSTGSYYPDLSSIQSPEKVSRVVSNVASADAVPVQPGVGCAIGITESERDSTGLQEQDNARDDLLRHGQMETEAAIRDGTARLVTCKGCKSKLRAPQHYRLIYCLQCGAVSPCR